MPDLGTRHECYNCGAKFYDLGKTPPLCPKCGANQKDAATKNPTSEGAALRKKRKDDLLRRTEYDEEFGHEAGADEDTEADEGVEGAAEDAEEKEEDDDASAE